MRQQNIILPAEWLEQSGVLLAWPHEKTDWSPQLCRVRRCVAAICAAITQVEDVYLLHDPSDLSFKCFLEASHSVMDRVKSIACRFNDTWVRDYAPLSVVIGHQRILLNFEFNAWGEKYAYALDQKVNDYLDTEGFFKAQVHNMPFVLEGGSIDSNGCGTLLTTTTCMRQRHPSLSNTMIEQQLKRVLGMQRVVMLQHGYLCGDDTDAHIDTLARFFSPTGIVYMYCDDAEDEHYAAFQAMQDELRALRTINGQAYQLEYLPWPPALYDQKGQRLPASYANFLIINGHVLLPYYGVAEDIKAKKVLEKCFPDRKVIPIMCESLIEQGGSLHCMTMQFPKGFVHE